jgi:hypothetical protein
LNVQGDSLAQHEAVALMRTLGLYEIYTKAIKSETVVPNSSAAGSAENGIAPGIVDPNQSSNGGTATEGNDVAVAVDVSGALTSSDLSITSSSSSLSSSLPSSAISAAALMRIPTGPGCTPSDVMMALNRLSSALLSHHGIQLPQIAKIINPQLRNVVRKKCLEFVQLKEILIFICLSI